MLTNDNVLKTKDQAFTEKLNSSENYKGSDGWPQNFKTQNRLIFQKLCRESSSLNLKTASLLRYNIEKKFNGYNKDDIIHIKLIFFS